MLIAALFLIAAATAPMDNDARAEWANRQLVAHQLPTTDKPVHANGDIFFAGTKRGAGDFVASGGTSVDSAGSGSLWVYDPLHHIVAVTEAGDVTGDMLWYGDAPPFPVVHRNLENVRSPRGIKLGMSLPAALQALGLQQSAVKKLPDGRDYVSTHQVLEVIKGGGGAERARDDVLVFEKGRAVYVSLAEYCC